MSKRRKEPKYLHTQSIEQSLRDCLEPEEEVPAVDPEEKQRAIYRMAGIRHSPKEIKELIDRRNKI